MLVVGLVVVSAIVVDPFGFQSFLLLRYVATLVLLLGAVGVMWRNGVSLPSSRVVQYLIIVFLGLLLTSAVLGRAPVVSVLGAAGRQVGWLAWVLFAIAFVSGLSLFDPVDGKRVEWALVVGFSVALIGVGVLAGLEMAGVPIVEVDQQFGSRVQGPFGNPAVLAAFVVLGLPVAVGGLVDGRLRVLSGVASVAGVVLLVMSGTRGAWIGAAAGAVFIGIGVVSRRRKPSWVQIGAGLTLVAVVVALTVLTGRWSSALSGFEGRVATWSVAVEVVGEYPIVGVGPEGFTTAFAETVGEEYVITYTRDDVVDRAHNGVLDVAVSGGIPAVAAYLMLLGAVGVVAWRAVRISGPSRPIVAGAVAGVVGYLVQQQVLFQTAVLDLVFWFVVGLLATVAGYATRRRPLRGLVAGLMVVVLVAAVYGAVGVYADHLDRGALEPGDADVAMLGLERAATLRPSDDIHAIIAAEISPVIGVPQINARAGRLTTAGLAVNPTNELLILAKTALLVDVYEASGQIGALDVAEAALLDLVARDTTNGDAYLRLGAIAFYKQDFQAAEAYWLRAQYLMPHRPEPAANLNVLRNDTE